MNFPASNNSICVTRNYGNLLHSLNLHYLFIFIFFTHVFHINYASITIRRHFNYLKIWKIKLNESNFKVCIDCYAVQNWFKQNANFKRSILQQNWCTLFAPIIVLPITIAKTLYENVIHCRIVLQAMSGQLCIHFSYRISADPSTKVEQMLTWKTNKWHLLDHRNLWAILKYDGIN